MSSGECLKKSSRRTAKGKGRGWSLVELLIALAIVSIFLIGVFTAFIQILRASDRSERTIEAYQNARTAVETIALYVKAARIEPGTPAQYFQGLNIPTPTGDRVDNDKDGRVDEEQPDGLDDDGDWVAARDDRHAQVGEVYERPRFVGVADLGDDHVDEDCVFHRDQLALAIFPDPAVPGGSDIVTSFAIGTWEGENNVLLQTLWRDGGTTGTGLPEIAPLAYNVLSLNFLYWDPNRSLPYWVEHWDAALEWPRPAPGLELPAAVYISVTVYAAQIPLDQLLPGQPIETVTASTVVNIEAVIHDPRYELVRPDL